MMVTKIDKIDNNEGSTPCEICSAKSIFRCSSCRRAFYCGRSHQTMHWKDHRSVCRIRRVFDEIKKAKRHRADRLLKKTNLNRLKKLLTSSGKDEGTVPGWLNVRYQPEYITTRALALDIINDLTNVGFSVIDNFLSESVMGNVRTDVKKLCQCGQFLPGKICQAPGTSQESVRGDIVKWLEVRKDCPYTAIKLAVQHMDKISQLLDESEILQGCDIKSRSPVMLAYYPVNSPGYKQHVDNPSHDGRKLTFILYTNKGYDKKRDGGVLRIHKKERKMYYDIEPIDNRLVIFWSDSRTPHEVLPTNKGRYALSLWYFDLVERARMLVRGPSEADRRLLETRFLP